MFINCKSFFSFHYGTYATGELVEAADQLGIRQLGIANINSTADAWNFVLKCQEKGIKPVVGVEIRNGNTLLYTLYARNNHGFTAINRFLSEHLQAKAAFPLRTDFAVNDIWVIFPDEQYLADLKDNERIAMKISQIGQLTFRTAQEIGKYIIMHAVTYQDKKRFNVHRILRAIANNTLLSKLRPEDIADADEYFVSPVSLMASFTAYPQLIVNSLALIDSCSLTMDFKADKNRKFFSSGGAEGDRELLYKLAMDGCKRRYGLANKEAFARVEKELEMINRLGFNAYFLIVKEILAYADERGFFHVGRGSGANSTVAYCLRITDVDPLALNLYFERFLNPNRSSPPDFDIDFSWQDRDEIIDYIFKRYGKEYVALLGMYSTFKYRAAVRELGKVFGLPKGEIDRIAAYPNAQAEDKIQAWVRAYAKLMEGIPNHLSIHAGGILISERPLLEYVQIELPPKGFPTIHMDMFEAERLHFSKFDILSQRGLGHIKDTIQLVEREHGTRIDIHQVKDFIKDPHLLQKIKTADTVGCFYIESPAMRQLLGKLQCADYITLVAASSIIRPGVAQSGMMRQYIERYHDPKKVAYLHPLMEELLGETYGVMVYQEDVIAVAHHVGGISLEDADILRRAMSGKHRSENKFEKLKAQFFANCHARGYAAEVTQEIWRQMESFGGYSFAKGHSASFAIESFQSLYLKTYYPREFYVAVLNNFGGFYRTEIYVHELQRYGTPLALPCVNNSGYLTDIVGKEIYAGFILLAGLTDTFGQKIVQERLQHGAYMGLQNFIERLNPAPEQLNILIRIGAFRFTGLDKKTLLWKANFSVKKAVKEAQALSLFEEAPLEFTLPAFTVDPKEELRDQLELLGFVVGDYFALLDPKWLEATLPVARFSAFLGQQIQVVGRLVTTKDVYTSRKEVMSFGTFLDAAGDWLDTVHFPPSLKHSPFAGLGFYKLSGKVVEEFGVYSLEVLHMQKLGYLL
ncbi:DNA polymerase III subunit alpha [Sphingobacteriaceae bacterium WQ 2009]|uniref:DNA polymerase III subunit alpha n=1 Tax=Rhinopithecimicrobium faecis TaxID=2820698 RepID=A0A8T4HA92_9SPHI|nr:DNA polymerase III subunit alpha [Sphingobacteriaceae bacterium WQ 2009]